MVGRPHDTRLLENLVKSEKDYYAALINLLALSHSSLASLSGYGSALNPSCSKAVLAVAETLTAADEGLRVYAESIDDWREKLGEIRRLDADIENAVRDREILVTRLIKVSKQKPRGAPAVGKHASSGSKLSQAQSELQACEAHLTAKQRELEEITRSAVQDGLEKRCKALVTCGIVWSEQGREGLKVLETLSNEPSSPLLAPNPPYTLSRPYFGRIGHSGSISRSIESNTSLAPSQSASQIVVNPTPRPSEDTHITTALGSNTPPTSTSAVPSPTYQTRIGSYGNTNKDTEPSTSSVREKDRSFSYRLDIPPAHSIDDHAVPASTLLDAPQRPAAEGSYEDGDAVELNSSSGSDEDGPVEVHENPSRGPAPGAVAVQIDAAAVAAVTDHEMKNVSTTRMGQKQAAPLFGNGTSRPPEPEEQGTVKARDGGKRRAATSDDRSSSPPRSKMSHLLHRSEPQPQQPTPREDSPPPPGRKRSASLGLFGGIAAFFNPKKNGSVRSDAPPSRPRATERDSSPGSKRKAKVNGTANGSGGGGWKTRTDKNLKDAKTEMVVGSARGPVSAAVDSSDDEDEQKKRAKRKTGSLFVMRNNTNGDASKPSDRDVMGNSVTGPSFGSHKGPLGTRPSKKRQGSASDVVASRGRSDGEDTAKAQRRMSRHSSDGALNSRSNSLSKPNAKTKSNGDLTRTATSASAKQVPPVPNVTNDPPTPKIPPKSPLRANSSELRAATGGGKIRKRAPGKHFDDGLGSSGGALIVGAQQEQRSKAAMAKGNESFGGMGVATDTTTGGGTGALSRGSTVRSTAAGVAGGGTKHQRKGSGGDQPEKVAATSTTNTAANIAPTQKPINAGASVSRNSSMASKTASTVSRGRPNNLMSIVEAPGAGLLEIVRAPGTVTGPQAPILELPSSRAFTPPPVPPVPTKDAAARRGADQSAVAPSSAGSKLMLPSELRVGQHFNSTASANTSKSTLPTSESTAMGKQPSASTATLRATDSTPRQQESTMTKREKHNSVPSAQAGPPLRSALRTRSPSPSASRGPSPANVSKPATVLAAVKAPLSVLAAARTSKVDRDDAGSVSSYETGHEMFEDALSSPAQVTSPLQMANGNGLMGFHPSPPKPPSDDPRGTDVSNSNDTDSTTQPRRRKSVRMALPPSATSTPAVTPAALEDRYRADAPFFMGQGISAPKPTAAPSVGRESAPAPPVKDVWADDDSDVGGEYGEARRALEKATEGLAKAGKKPRTGTHG